MDKTLRGQVALISGGLGDIGRAIAVELARRGADVAVGDLLEAVAAEPLLKEITGLNRRGRYDRVDVTDPDAVTAWVASVEAELGLATLVIPNAAIVQLVSFGELTADQWQRELAVNLNGAFYLAHAATARMVHHKKSGRVVFLGSWAAHSVHTHIPAYCVSKAGLRMLCQCMAAELAAHDILVNEVAPGWVDAGLTGQLFDKEPARRKSAVDVIPVGRLIEADEVAAQVAHLCEPTNRHMTGSTLLMDGGLSLLGPSTKG